MKRLRVANCGGVNINNKKRKGFTLIELLAVIVILAIIAVIATPIILGIVESTRKDAFQRSVELVIKSTDLDLTNKTIASGYEYELIDGKIFDKINKILDVDGYEITENCVSVLESKGAPEDIAELWCSNTPLEGFGGLTLTEAAAQEPGMAADFVSVGAIKEKYPYEEKNISTNTEGMNGIIEYDKNGKSVFAIHNGKYCVRKTKDMAKPQIIDYEEGNCETMDFTDASCFTYEDGDTGIVITDYTCDITDVVIPKILNGTNVTEIGEYAFSEKGLTSVVLPTTIEKIGERAFSSNQITGIIDLAKLPNLYKMDYGVFRDNQLSGAIIPTNYETDDTYDFNCPFGENLDNFVARYPDSTVFDWDSKTCA